MPPGERGASTSALAPASHPTLHLHTYQYNAPGHLPVQCTCTSTSTMHLHTYQYTASAHFPLHNTCATVFPTKQHQYLYTSHYTAHVPLQLPLPFTYSTLHLSLPYIAAPLHLTPHSTFPITYPTTLHVYQSLTHYTPSVPLHFEFTAFISIFLNSLLLHHYISRFTAHPPLHLPFHCCSTSTSPVSLLLYHYIFRSTVPVPLHLPFHRCTTTPPVSLFPQY